MPPDSRLTQREIDTLLSGGPGEGERQPAKQPGGVWGERGFGKTVRRYDFRRPDKFSKEHLRSLQSLQSLHETFARAAGTALTNQVRCNVEIKLSSIEQGLYEEYVGQVAGASFVHTLEMSPLDGSIVIQYGQDFDRLLGGAGAQLENGHEVTDVELHLLRGFAEMLAAAMGEAWSNLCPVTPSVADTQMDINLAQIAPPSEVVTTVLMEITLLDTVGVLSVCTPYSVLEGVLSRLSAQSWVGTGGRKQPGEIVGQLLRRQIERTRVPISADYGSASVRARDLARLEVGDVIRLDAPITHTVPVRVGGVRKWLARPGRSSGRMAVRIERWAPEEVAGVGQSAAGAGEGTTPLPSPTTAEPAAESERNRAA